MATELDYMEYANDAAAQAAYPSSEDTIDDDLSSDNFTYISNDFTYDGVNDQMDFSCVRDGVYSRCYQVLGRMFTQADDFTFEFKVRLSVHDIGSVVAFGLFDTNNATSYSVNALFAYHSRPGGSTYATAGSIIRDDAGSQDADTDAESVQINVTYTVVATYTASSREFNVKWYDGESLEFEETATLTGGRTFAVDCIAGSNSAASYSGNPNVDGWFDDVKFNGKEIRVSSEDTIKQQGFYSLKGVALQTTSLNGTLTRTIGSPIDLSDMGQLKYDIYSSRTGSNIKIGIHDSGGTTTEYTANISSASTWETQTWDISAVTNANKDIIDSIIITIVNADADNTFYVDNFYNNKYLSSLVGSLAFTDTITKKTSRSLADTVAFTDAIAKKTKRALADTLAFTDAIAKKTKKALADTIAFTDAITKKIKKALADTIAFTDAIAKKTKRALADTIAFTDTITKKIKKVLADNISFVDKLLGWLEKVEPDSIYTEESDPSSAWTEEDDPDSIYTEESDPSSTWTEEDDPDSDWEEE